MIESLVITLREGIEAALVVGIILAYLNKTGLRKLNSYVRWGLALGVFASVAGAIAFNSVGIDPHNKVFEGTAYFISAVFVISMVIWMWRTSKNVKKDMEQRLDRIVLSEKNTGKGLGLMAFTFIMVFREGIETVLFLAALEKGSSPAASIIGAVTGLIVAIGIGGLMVYGSIKIDIGLFFKVTGIALILLTIKLLAGGMLEFAEAGILSVGHEIEEFLEFVAEGGSSQIISAVLVAIPLVAFVYSLFKGGKQKEEVVKI